MTQHEAIKILEEMPEDDFQSFFALLPERVKILVKAGFVDWEKTLSIWFLKKRRVENENNCDF